MNDMLEQVANNQFMPHGYCFLWRPELVWIHAMSDITIALAYFTIPLTILIIMNKQKKAIPFTWVFGMFATFIFLCGLTHIIDVIAIWQPVYYFSGVIKMLTAAVSLATAMLMFPLIPTILRRFDETKPSTPDISKDRG